MKYKILLIGTHQPLISDFFNHTDFTFELLTSSVRTDDLTGHIKYYEPQALVYCLNKDNSDDIRSLRNVVINRLSGKKIPLIVIGESSDCASFEKIYPSTDYFTIMRPFSTNELTEKISAYLDDYYAQLEENIENEPAQEEAEQTEPAASEKKKHILIVDDDSGVLKLARNILGEQYNVATAINGKVAMKFLEKKDTDLVLLDYEMPEESGAEVLQKIRSNARLQKLPVVFLTGVTEKERIQKVLSFSPQGYLLKPINAERLNETLKAIFKDR